MNKSFNNNTKYHSVTAWISYEHVYTTHTIDAVMLLIVHYISFASINTHAENCRHRYSRHYYTAISSSSDM